MRRQRLGAGAAAGVAALLAFAVLTGRPAPASDGGGFVLEAERYNDTYTGLETVAPPIVSGPLTIRLTAPRYDLTVLANRLELEPATECRHRASLWGRFSGDGELLADVELGAFPARFEDRVRIPEQEKRIEGRVYIEEIPSGYRVTLEELPARVTVRIESQLASGLVSFCRRLSLFVAGDAGCGALDRVLSNPPLALPEPGTQFVVRHDELTEEEREQLVYYLSRRTDCTPPSLEGGPA